MSTSIKILVGSNNAYSWYAVIGSSGELIDCAAEHDLQLSAKQPFEGYLVNALLDYAANGECWEGRWSDAYEREIEDIASREGVSIEAAIAEGEQTALALFGGSITREINL